MVCASSNPVLQIYPRGHTARDMFFPFFLFFICCLFYCNVVDKFRLEMSSYVNQRKRRTITVPSAEMVCLCLVAGLYSLRQENWICAYGICPFAYGRIGYNYYVYQSDVHQQPAVWQCGSSKISLLRQRVNIVCYECNTRNVCAVMCDEYDGIFLFLFHPFFHSRYERTASTLEHMGDWRDISTEFCILFMNILGFCIYIIIVN